MKRYSLIEYLVFFLIIGVFVAVMAFSVSSSRAKVRDAKRLSDVKQVQAALELYYNDHNQYPVTTDPLTLGEGLDCQNAPCSVLSLDGGFSSRAQGLAYMSLIPANPTPNGSAYQYLSDGKTYFIAFSLESTLGTFVKGPACAKPFSVFSGNCQ